MSLSNAIKTLQSNIPANEEQAQKFLDSLSQETQKKLIAAIYIGREHIHSTVMREDMDIDSSYTDHIPKEDYARIVYERVGSLDLYFRKLEECAKNSNFDIEEI
jgi:phosphotransacetylase